jgi:hypothetical protein
MKKLFILDFIHKIFHFLRVKLEAAIKAVNYNMAIDTSKEVYHFNFFNVILLFYTIIIITVYIYPRILGII